MFSSLLNSINVTVDVLTARRGLTSTASSVMRSSAASPPPRLRTTLSLVNLICMKVEPTAHAPWVPPSNSLSLHSATSVTSQTHSLQEYVCQLCNHPPGWWMTMLSVALKTFAVDPPITSTSTTASSGSASRLMASIRSRRLTWIFASTIPSPL